ncbi:beta-galactosidase [bacterium]|nr:beta-galactosidase [bacterium]
MHRGCALLICLAAAPSFAQQTVANWIWYPEVASGECVDQSRYLRKTFDLPAGVTAAYLDLVVDDRQTLFANGEGPLRPVEREAGPPHYDLGGLLKPGRNVIAVQAHNVTGAAGVIARLVLQGPGDATTVIGSDATWRASRTEQEGWTSAQFDDSAWSAAKVIGPAISLPWSEYASYHCTEMLSEQELADYRKFEASIVAPAEQFAKDPPLRAAVKHHNGSAAVFINGVPRPAVMYRGTVAPASVYGRRQISNFSDAGIHLQCVYTTLLSCWRGPGEYDFSALDTLLRSYLSADPDAYLLLHIRLLAPEWWMNAHPEEWVRYATSDDLDSSDESYRVKRASPASALWLQDASEAWRAAIRHIQSQPWGKRVLGYHAGYGIYTEWHYFGSWSDQYPDTSPAMARTFRAWLRDKYTTVDALRKAWRDDAVTFENAAVPAMAARRTATLVTLRDPALERPVIDYYHCQQQVIADDIETFGKIVKEETDGGALYGVYYGYFFGVRPQAQGGHLALERLLGSPYIDYFVAPYSYSDRLMGQDGRLRSLIAAINAAGKVHFIEADIRTYLHPRQEHGRTDTLAETLAAIRREFGTSLIEHTGFWFVDFGPEGRGGWFDQPQIMAEAKALQQVATKALAEPHRSAAEIAVVCDLESGYLLSDAEGMSQAYSTTEKVGTELFHLGAPLDFLLLSQLESLDLSRYKLLVFLNTTRMTPSQAKLVESLRRSGRHATVFLWAPGLCSPESLSVAQASQVTGLSLSLTKGWLPAAVELSEQGVQLARGIATRTEYSIRPDRSTPVAAFGDTSKWLNPRTPDQMESYTLYEVKPIDRGIAWSFDTRYPWTDLHFGAEMPPGDGVGFEVKLDGNCSRLVLRTVIKDANLAEFQAAPVTLVPGDWQRLSYPLAAFTSAPWSKLKPEKIALPLRGMKFVLDGTNVAGRCTVSMRDLAAISGPVSATQVCSYGDGLFTPALIPATDRGQVLGRVAGAGDPAILLTGEGRASSLFSAVPYVPRELLCGMARRAGVHQYLDAPGDVLRADSRFLCLHTKDGGPRKLNLPSACTVRDAFTGSVLGKGTSLDLDLPPNSTTLLEYEP